MGQDEGNHHCHRRRRPLRLPAGPRQAHPAVLVQLLGRIPEGILRRPVRPRGEGFPEGIQAGRQQALRVRGRGGAALLTKLTLVPWIMKITSLTNQLRAVTVWSLRL